MHDHKELRDYLLEYPDYRWLLKQEIRVRRLEVAKKEIALEKGMKSWKAREALKPYSKCEDEDG